MELVLIQPGEPTQIAYIDSVDGKFWDGCLNENWFTPLKHAKTAISTWRRDHNQGRIQSAIGNLSPMVFAATIREQGFAKPTPSDKVASQDSTD